MKQKKREKEAEKHLLQMAITAEEKSETKGKEVSALCKQSEKRSGSDKTFPSRSSLLESCATSSYPRNQFINHTSSVTSVIVKSELIECPDVTI